MKIRLFYHSLLSDWNHGNAHFLRGISTELIAQGHDVRVYEPVDGWSLANLRREYGVEPIDRFHAAYPRLNSIFYDPATFDPEQALADADLVIVHEWTDPDLVRQIGFLATRSSFVALFHDTHHRLLSESAMFRGLGLHRYDGVLAYGRALQEMYLSLGLAQRAWVWHEAADIRRFKPMSKRQHWGDLVWIGNWGDGERTEELREFLLEPVKALGLKARVYGVRYPPEARRALEDAGIEYAGWLPNFEVPDVFAAYKVTVHIPRRPYVKALEGIPTIRIFEALACGIPMICSPWNDTEGLFRAGDYRRASDGREMTLALAETLASPHARKEMASSGLETITARHTCALRVRELIHIVHEAEIHKRRRHRREPQALLCAAK